MMGQENYSQSTYLTNLAIFGYLKKKIPSKYDNFEPFLSKKNCLYKSQPPLLLLFCHQVIKISPQKNIDRDIIKIGFGFCEYFQNINT
jgi:hypothetical protein